MSSFPPPKGKQLFGYTHIHPRRDDFTPTAVVFNFRLNKSTSQAKNT